MNLLGPMNLLDLLIPAAHAQAASPAVASGNPLTMFAFPIIMIGVLYFIMIRPQMKRQKEHRDLLTKLQKGDEVITSGGLAGRVADIGDAFVTLEVADGVLMKFQRTAIATVLPRGSLKAS